MPHKRAKRSVRELQRSQKGSDLAPNQNSLSNEAIPKSLSRVLNAAQIHEDWKLKKRKSEDDGSGKNGKKRRVDNEKGKGKETGQAKGKSKVLGIQPGESLGHFNRRVEDDMRPLVKTAMQGSLLVARNVRKAELEAKEAKKNKNLTGAAKSKVDIKDVVKAPSPPPVEKHAGRPKEFVTTSSSAPRRLNDIAQAPPEFKKLPRGVVRQDDGGVGSGKREGVLSMAQKVMMVEEREKAILRYRELKAKRRREGGGGDERDRDGEDED